MPATENDGQPILPEFGARPASEIDDREWQTWVDRLSREGLSRSRIANHLAVARAIYGWANTPNQTMPKRLDHVSPIEGLYLAGHWTDPGTGSVRCLLSGLRTAATIMGHQDPIAFLGTLHAGAPR